MSKLIFILGGARSGKSSFACKLAGDMCPPGGGVVYLATAEVTDDEMAQRIARHKARRPSHWQTIEEPRNLARITKILGETEKIILLDCLTILLSNIILSEVKDQKDLYKHEERLIKSFSFLAEAAAKSTFPVIFVSNEVGMGICPENYLGRIFRDLVGRINQEISRKAADVYFLRAGIPQKIKG